MTALLVRSRDPSRPWRTSGPGPGPTFPAEIGDATSDRPLAHLDDPADPIRARRILGAEIRYVDHPSFDDPGARDAILAPTPVPDVAEDPRHAEAPAGLTPYLASLYHEALLLSRDQEVHLFRKMNYLKSRASRIRDRIDPARVRTSDLDEIERHLEEATAIKTQLVRANLRLVVSIARQKPGPRDDLFERISEGNYVMIRAVERFDYSRGNKFSTYATWAIRNQFTRAFRGKHGRLTQFLFEQDNALEAAVDPRTDALEQSEVQERRREMFARLFDRLSDRERRVLVSRFGIDGAEVQTLKQIGTEMGITRERVRQIEVRAQAKLRNLASTASFALLQS